MDSLDQHLLGLLRQDARLTVATLAQKRGVAVAMHTHTNHANSVTPAVARASAAMLEAGLRDMLRLRSLL